MSQAPRRAPAPTPAEVEFNTSSIHPVPTGYTPFRIRNDYPPPPPQPAAEEWQATRAAALSPGGPILGVPDAPWLNVDPILNPMRYMEVIKEYCLEGMANNDYIPQNNPVRDWYHAPWLHPGDGGREPLRGLTWERGMAPKEFSATQTERYTQIWALAFFNSPAASVFGGMWADPNNPRWNDSVGFPMGSLIYKMIFTDATDEELPIMKGALEWNAVIAAPSKDPKNVAPDPANRNSKPSVVRLFQLDFAARDHHSVTGWIYGTSINNGWQESGIPMGILPVGLMWGNDPDLTQAKFEAGAKPVESWVHPHAEMLRLKLGGGRPDYGWNGRMNGPADGFISACISCHSSSVWPSAPDPRLPGMMPPKPVYRDGKWVPEDDNETMKWFETVPWGHIPTRISKVAEEDNIRVVSGDTSMQLLIGWRNHQHWLDDQHGRERTRFEHIPDHPRAGPRLEF